MSYLKKTVIVTGASNGIGRGIARGYAEKGASVVLADMDEQAGIQFVKEMNQEGYETLFIKTDVRKEADILHLMEITQRTYGTVDILINNAGKKIGRAHV